MNKEDIWVASIPVPIVATVTDNVHDVFNELPDGDELKFWNTYDLAWASTKIEKKNDGKKYLTLRDHDAFDYARAERVIPFAPKMEASFTVLPEQNNHGILQIEFQNKQGLPAVRLIFDSDGLLKTKTGARFSTLTKYEAGKSYTITMKLDAQTRSYSIKVNDDKESTKIAYAPVDGFSRIMFRTGEARTFPTPETPADVEDYNDLKDTGKQIPEAVFHIQSLTTKAL
jgi:hypothetical protein